MSASDITGRPLDSRIDDTTRMECRICGYVYDPALGDDEGEVPPETPFSALPTHWRCPTCDAGREAFLPLAG